MSRLNDALGDGSFIPINKDNILEELGPEKLLLLEKTKLAEKIEMTNKEAAHSCADKLCQKYVGVPCMGSTLHPYVADVRDPYQNFFFDEKYAKKCSQATSTRVRILIFFVTQIFFPPSKSEYFFQQHWESEYFLRKKP